jgi:benzoyl-CoA reductase/2-hydroxyglutaryl-CoA dehydratase subunit BcrC/BadD/HgdB
VQVHPPAPRSGLLQRLDGLTSVIDGLPDTLGDAEAEGLRGLLPADTARAMEAVLEPAVRPVSIPFLKLLSGWLREARQARERGRKVILIPFNFPPEVIHIFRNAVPLTCEVLTTLGVATLEGQGERYWEMALELGIPDFLCSASTIALGSLLSGRDFAPDAIVQATAGACDANSKIHEFAARHLELPQLFVEKPTDSSPRGRRQYRQNFLRFIEQLERLLGEELDEDHMRGVLRQANEAAALYDDLYDLQRLVPSPVPNLFALYTYSVRFSAWGRPEAVRLMRAMVELARGRLERGEHLAREELARCLWLYVGYYYDLWGLFSWMERRGISYLADALSLCAPARVDLSSKQSMLEGLARAAFDYPMTRQMGAESMTDAWSEDMIQAIHELRPSFTVYSGHHACKQTWSVFARVRQQILERTGVPVLCLQGDAWNRQMTPIGVLQQEISTFVETVVTRRPRAVGGRRRRRRRRGG